MRTQSPGDYQPGDYQPGFHRGRVEAYLKRAMASAVTGVAAVVYTRAAYLGDPEVQEVLAPEATHVLVAVLAFAGPPSPLSPVRFTMNLAGGNNEALAWTADEIRAKAADIQAYDAHWCVVADEAE